MGAVTFNAPGSCGAVLYTESGFSSCRINPSVTASTCIITHQVSSLQYSDSAEIEVVDTTFHSGGYRAAIFDFDGTLSLLRRNWQDVMIPMMVEILKATGTRETTEQLHELVENFVMLLNGRQTIYQMIRLAEEVAKRGGHPFDPLQYKHQYHDRLWDQVGSRVESVRGGRTPAEQMLVRGSLCLLDSLHQRGLTLYLASGTDLTYVRDEAQVLGIDRYFGPHIYGALDEYKTFSKAMILEQIVSDTGVRGEQIVGFGDGFVEVEEVRKIGGLAIGVASNEKTLEGIDLWKRTRLIDAGAQIIIADYRQMDRLLSMIGLA